MKYINTFKNHSSYEEKLNGGGETLKSLTLVTVRMLMTYILILIILLSSILVR